MTSTGSWMPCGAPATGWVTELGTSTVHRSPSTGRWRYVDSMYADERVNRSRLLSEVLNAATGYVDGLTDAAVLARVETLLRVGATRWADSDDPIGVASDVVREAQAAGRAAGLVSFYGDLADRALFATIARSASNVALTANPATTLSTFTRELIGFAVDHLVSRDLTAHLGGSSLPNAGAMVGLRRALVEAAQSLVDSPSLAQQTRAAAASPRDSWRALVSSALKAGRDLPETE